MTLTTKMTYHSNMNNYIESKVSVVTTDTTGKARKSTVTYLCQEESFARAEQLSLENSAAYGEVSVQKMQVVKYSEIIRSANVDADLLFYKFRVAFITLDEKSSKEKRTIVSILVEGTDDKDARKNFEQAMATSVTDWQVVSIVESPINEIV